MALKVETMRKMVESFEKGYKDKLMKLSNEKGSIVDYPESVTVLRLEDDSRLSNLGIVVMFRRPSTSNGVIDLAFVCNDTDEGRVQINCNIVNVTYGD